MNTAPPGSPIPRNDPEPHTATDGTTSQRDLSDDASPKADSTPEPDSPEALSARLVGLLSEFARTMLTDFAIQNILNHLVRRIVDTLPVDGAGVTLIQSPDPTPHYIAASDDAALRYEQLQTEVNEGPCLLAVHIGKPVQVPDLNVDDRFPHFAPRALAAGLAAVFTFPLWHGSSQLGALGLYRRSPGPLMDRQLTAAQTLADVASAYIVNAKARADLQQEAQRFQHASLHDELTGLPNRALLLERLGRALLRSGRSRKKIAVLFIDLDDFKQINDVHGHNGGDQLLVAVGEKLSHLIRPHDTVARFGGDEFVVLCEDLDSADHAHTISARLITALAQPFTLFDLTVTVTASVGLATTDKRGQSPEALLRAADVAMYEAKRNRKAPTT